MDPGPVLHKAPSCQHPYISHAYIRAPRQLLPSPLAFLCLQALVTRARARVRRRAGENEALWFEKFRRACGLGRYDVVARIALSLQDEASAEEFVHALSFECLRRPLFFTKLSFRSLREHDVEPQVALKLWRQLELWWRAQEPTQSPWNEVIYALVLADQLDEALQILEAMERGEAHLPAPSGAMFCVVVPALAQTRGIPAAREIVSRQKAQGIHVEFVYHLLMAVIYSHGTQHLEMAKLHVRKGERLLRGLRSSAYPHREIQYEPTYLYATLMAAYRRMGRLRDCFSLIGVMRQHGIRPDNVTFAVLQQACWGNLDATAQVRQVLRLMDDMQVAPGTINYNALIRSYGEAGQFTNALQVANRLREAAIPWDEYTYQYLLAAAVTAGQVELALRLLYQMRSQGVRPKAKQYVTVFLGLAEAGFYEDASRVFERLVAIGCCSTEAYNVMLGIHCKRGSMEEARGMMERMEEAAVGPDVWSFRLLVEGYSFLGDFEAALSLQDVLTSYRQNLEQVAKDVLATPAAREVAQKELEKRTQWTRIYDYLIDAAVWQGEWSRGVGLLKDVVDLGLPVDVEKRRRLLQDMKDFYEGKDRVLGISAEVISARQFVEEKSEQWMASLPNMKCETYGYSLAAVQEEEVQLPLQAFAASFAPHWLDGARLRPLEELVEELGAEEVLDANLAYEVMCAYYHATLHRRPVVPLDLGEATTVVRACTETPSSLRELFGEHGWPSASSTAYIFMRPSACSLDVLLHLLALAAAFPQKLLLLREAHEPKDLAQQGRQRGWSRAAAVTLSATLRSLPLALLLNGRTLLINADCDMSCQRFESNLRDALAGQQPQEEQKEPQASSSAAWATWLRSQGLRRLLRHDGTKLRSDGLGRAMAAEAPSFGLVARKGQVDVQLPTEL